MRAYAREAMRLLIAEDHPSLARSIANGMREEGYAVDLTFDGDEALHLAKANAYDGIVLDMMLPGKDGWTILPTLRRSGLRTPVLCLTARDAIEDRVRGLDLGADDYLVKPFALRELQARLRALLRRSGDGVGDAGSAVRRVAGHPHDDSFAARVDCCPTWLPEISRRDCLRRSFESGRV